MNLKKYLVLFVAILAIGLNFYFLLSIKEDMELLRMRIVDLSSSMDSYGSMVHSTVLNAVEEGNSIIEFSNYDFKNFDKDKNTIEFNYKITPKEYSANSKAYLSINGVEEQMVLVGSDFIFNRNIPMDKEFTVGNFSLANDENTRVQRFDEKIFPLKELTFSIHAIPVSYSYSSGDEVQEFEIPGDKLDFSIYYDHLIEREEDIKDMFKPKVASVVFYIDDKLTHKEDYNIVYKDESEATIDKIQGFDCFINFKKIKFDVPQGNKVEVNLEIKDKFGFTHILNLVRQNFTDDDSSQNVADYYNNYVKKDGKIIYRYDY